MCFVPGEYSGACACESDEHPAAGLERDGWWWLWPCGTDGYAGWVWAALVTLAIGGHGSSSWLTVHDGLMVLGLASSANRSTPAQSQQQIWYELPGWFGALERVHSLLWKVAFGHRLFPHPGQTIIPPNPCVQSPVFLTSFASRLSSQRWHPAAPGNMTVPGWQ